MKCLVPTCKNRSDMQNWKKRLGESNNVKVTFHSLPKNASICSLWLDQLGIKLSSISRTARICSAHFEEKCFDRSGSYVRLRPNALPRRTVKEEESSPTDTNSPNLSQDDVDIKVSPNIVQCTTLETEKDTMILDDISKSSDKCSSPPRPSTSKENKGTMVSPTFIYNSPEKTRLRQRIKFLEADSRKKMRVMQQKLRRKNNRILTLKNILDDLKSKQMSNESNVK